MCSQELSQEPGLPFATLSPMSALIIHDVSLIGYEQVMSRTSPFWFIVRITSEVGFKIQIYKPNPRDAESQSLEQSLHTVFRNFLREI